LGSKAFVNRIDSLKLKPIVDLNVDMIGRGEDSRMELNSKVKKLYVIAAKKDSLLVNKIKAIHLGADSLRVDYSSKILYTSDQTSFMRKGIPAVMFFRGLHPDYHTEHDTPEKLDYATMERVARLIFKVSWKYVMDENQPH
jgi:Zn-dependent M28 family amino/carboxypeptidase